jgi:putative MATE family efflux protein
VQDLTTGSVTRHLLKTTSFMLVTMEFQTLYFLVDLYWVGRLSKEAVAAVSVGGTLMFVVLAITQMLAVGATTLISHATGQKNRDRALLVFNQALVLSAVVGTIFFVVAMVVRTPFARALSADLGTARLAGDYLLWFIPAMALQFPLVTMAATLRGTGNFKPGMLVQTATVILNMVLAPFLIFGWVTGHPLGVAGAALATFIAIVVGTVWLSFFFRARNSYLEFMTADWKPHPGLWAGMLKIGLPAGAEFALVGVYLFVVYVVIRPFGAAAQAGFGIGLRIIQAGFMPVVALGFAVAPVAGQNFGARLPDRVRETFRSAVIGAGAIMLLFALLCHVAPEAMIRLFTSDPQVVAVGDEYLRIVSWSYVASGVAFVCSSMFQAMGNTWPSLIGSGVRVSLAVVPALFLARLPGFQLHWVWYLAVTATTVQALLVLLLVRPEFRARLNFEPVPAVVPSPPALDAETTEAVAEGQAAVGGPSKAAGSAPRPD